MGRIKKSKRFADGSARIKIGEGFMSALRIEALPTMDRTSVNHLNIFTVSVFGHAKDAKEISFTVDGFPLRARIKKSRQQNGAQSQSKTHRAIHEKITDDRRNPGHDLQAPLARLQAELRHDQYRGESQQRQPHRQEPIQ